MSRHFIASLATVIGIVASGSAMAADLYPPVYKALPPPLPTWTGCYLNAGAGGGMWDSKANAESYPGLVATSASLDNGGHGWLGTAGGGCDYQFHFFAWNVVVGAFGDYDLMDLHGNWADGVGGAAGSASERSAWAGGLRAGYLVLPTLLTYVNGGYTGTRFDAVNLAAGFPPAPTGTFLAAHTYGGWFLGGGTEYALTFDWLPISGLFWRNEYRYSNYETADVPVISTATGLPVSASHISNSVQTITTSLVWRFNWAGPLAVRD